MPSLTFTRQFELTRALVSSFVLLIADLSEADKLRLSPFFPYRPEEDNTVFPNILFWSIALNALHRTFAIPREVLDNGLREEFTILPRWVGVGVRGFESPATDEGLRAAESEG
jgi:hypothetical protein